MSRGELFGLLLTLYLCLLAQPQGSLLHQNSSPPGPVAAPIADSDGEEDASSALLRFEDRAKERENRKRKQSGFFDRLAEVLWRLNPLATAAEATIIFGELIIPAWASAWRDTGDMDAAVGRRSRDSIGPGIARPPDRLARWRYGVRLTAGALLLLRAHPHKKDTDEVLKGLRRLTEDDEDNDYIAIGSASPSQASAGTASASLFDPLARRVYLGRGTTSSSAAVATMHETSAGQAVATSTITRPSRRRHRHHLFFLNRRFRAALGGGAVFAHGELSVHLVTFLSATAAFAKLCFTSGLPWPVRIWGAMLASGWAAVQVLLVAFNVVGGRVAAKGPERGDGDAGDAKDGKDEEEEQEEMRVFLQSLIRKTETVRSRMESDGFSQWAVVVLAAVAAIGLGVLASVPLTWSDEIVRVGQWSLAELLLWIPAIIAAVATLLILAIVLPGGIVLLFGLMLMGAMGGWVSSLCLATVVFVALGITLYAVFGLHDGPATAVEAANCISVILLLAIPSTFFMVAMLVFLTTLSTTGLDSSRSGRIEQRLWQLSNLLLPSYALACCLAAYDPASTCQPDWVRWLG